ncbi:hypothetical protein Hypma_011153 [Hypsizygus marmoreus]|uniref:Fe2OG dioxygenase domain-containing protein n=1 Tax=Hypsizygus marmoreus TaxID=39966 RepID=A0A369JR89_HYPMA|nr:hypothetical protein Hypma_011153 [Hypsizygus marmoreus]
MAFAAGMAQQQDHPSLPIIDFSAFLDGSGKQAVANAMLSSLQSIGFVYLTNHGLSDNDVQNIFNWTCDDPPFTGYSPPGLEKISQVVEGDLEKGKDVKESFESGREEDELMPNIWLPDGVLPGFKEACLDFFWICFQLEKTILKALAIVFNLPEDYFLSFHTKPDNQLRLLHYPSVPLHALETHQISRINGHTDFGSLTILFQDDVGGLEVEDPHSPGRFVSVQPAPPVPGSIVVNAGDFLMRWSNDTIRSTAHRVRSPPGLVSVDGLVPERYSIPYFCCADFSTIVDAIPGSWSVEKPKKYPPISAAEYVLERLAANY